METRVEYREWDKLMPDILALIFTRLQLNEKLNVVPSVCKSWEKVIKCLSCWDEIDLLQWSLSLSCSPDCYDRMLTMLIGRSSGSLQKLSVYGLRTEFGLSLITDNANKLWNLQIPGSLISNAMVVKVSKKLSNLTHLDLSYNTKIDGNAIAGIGSHCKKLTHFKRKMSPFLIPFQKCQDDETLVIAAMMPQLKHLELNYLFITTEGVLRIIKNCLELEFLDIGGCWNVDIDADCELLKNRLKLKVVNEVSGEVDDSHFNYTAMYLDEYVDPQDLNDLCTIDDSEESQGQN